MPRAIARFSSPEAWSQGWILRHSPPRVRDPLQRVPTVKRNADWTAPTAREKREQFATTTAGSNHWTDRFDIQTPRVAPRHVPSLKTVLYPVSSQFSHNVFGYSAGQAVILAGYASLIAIGLLLYTNPVTNARRAGWIALSQFPVSFLLASKNSLIGLLVRKGYEKLNYLHRWVGQLMFIATLFHVVSYRKRIIIIIIFVAVVANVVRS